MSELDRYLSRATRGLPRRERQAVQDELRANIEQRRRELLALGYAGEQALHEALREFGAPEQANRGFLRVHTLPALLNSVLFTVSLATAALGMLSWSHAAALKQRPTAENCSVALASQARQARIQHENQKLFAGSCSK